MGLLAAWLAIGLGGCDDTTVVEDGASRTRRHRTSSSRPPANSADADEAGDTAADGAGRAEDGASLRPASATPQSDWPSALDGMPDIDTKPRERADMELARRLFKRGLEDLRRDDFESGAERFFEAIEVDPGSIDARYNLACALSRMGDRPAAVVVLDQLRDEGCGSCLGKVLKARRDPDFDAIRKNKGFASVVADVEAGLLEVQPASDAVAAWVGALKKAETPVVLDPRRKVTVRVGCPTCPRGQKPEIGVVRGGKALRSWVERKRRAFSGGIASAVVAECKGKCCSFVEPDPSTASPDTLFLGEACFRLESGFATSLSKFSLYRYPAVATGDSEDGG